MQNHALNEWRVYTACQTDIITVHGRKVRSAPKVYFLLNKPKSVVCTNSDPQGRRKAIDIIKADQRIFCVGRLDIDTTGLIILTNDSDLTNKLTHPKYKISKTYVAKVKGLAEGKAIDKLKKGVWLSEGKTGKSAVKVLKRSHDESLVEIIISQGLNRQVRRAMAKVGLKVKSLKRTRIGKITDRGISVGKFRKLSESEIEYLKKM